MKLLILIFINLIAFSDLTFSQEKTKEEKIADIMREQNKQAGTVPSEGFVPNLEVATEVAKAVLKPILKKDLKKELPLRGKREGDVWIIEGRKRKGCPPKKENCMMLDQSPIYVEIDAKEGKILKVIQYK